MTRLPLSFKYVAINCAAFDAPTNIIASELFKNTPTNFANSLAVVAFNNTVPSTIMNTNGVIYSDPGTPIFNSFPPKRDAIPAATIPRGPTQLMNNFSLNFNLDLVVLKNTANGRIKNTTAPNKAAVFQE